MDNRKQEFFRLLTPLELKGICQGINLAEEDGHHYDDETTRASLGQSDNRLAISRMSNQTDVMVRAGGKGCVIFKEAKSALQHLPLVYLAALLQDYRDCQRNDGIRAHNTAMMDNYFRIIDNVEQVLKRSRNMADFGQSMYY